MFRVTKVDSHFAVVTYGEPELRLNLFMETLPKNKYELHCKKISLSFMSNLINSLRNNSSDFTISKAVKDKNVLIHSIFDACISKIKNECDSEVKTNNSELVTDKRKKLMQLKMLKLIYERKKEKEMEKQKELNEDAVEEPKEIEEPVEKTNEIVNVVNTVEGKIKLDEDEEDNKEINARRTYCFLYLFKKVKN
jgi:hypothetical protein